jgi:hypothetical protein
MKKNRASIQDFLKAFPKGEQRKQSFEALKQANDELLLQIRRDLRIKGVRTDQSRVLHQLKRKAEADRRELEKIKRS